MYAFSAMPMGYFNRTEIGYDHWKLEAVFHVSNTPILLDVFVLPENQRQITTQSGCSASCHWSYRILPLNIIEVTFAQ